MTKSIAIFTEAGTKRGMGHLIRCNTIYTTLKQKGFDVEFFLDSDIDFSYKFQYINYFQWDEVKIEKNYSIIFIDSYLADLDIYEKLSLKGKLLVCLDDYGRLEYPKNSMILNFAPDASELFFKKRKIDNKYLLGLKYIPIRNEFLQVEKQIEKEHLLIMLGGGLDTKLINDILKALENISIKKVIVSNSSDLEKSIENKENIDILYRPSDKELVEVMNKSKLAISTASMTVYELSYLNIPNIIIAISKNQEIGSSQLIRHKLAKEYVCLKNLAWEKQLEQSVKEFISLGHKKSNIVDGFGIENIINSVLKEIS